MVSVKRVGNKNECSFNACNKRAVKSCKYCDAYFCNEHLTPRISYTRKTIDEIPDQRQKLEYIADYRAFGGHPCFRYTQECDARHEDRRHIEADALNDLLDNNKRGGKRVGNYIHTTSQLNYREPDKKKGFFEKVKNPFMERLDENEHEYRINKLYQERSKDEGQKKVQREWDKDGNEVGKSRNKEASKSETQKSGEKVPGQPAPTEIKKPTKKKGLLDRVKDAFGYGE